jgi:TctA family transporter
LILNLPFVGLFVNLLRIPYTYLVPAILVISIIGVYSVGFSSTDIWIMVRWRRSCSPWCSATGWRRSSASR